LSEDELEDRRNQTRYAADIEVQGFHGSYSGVERYKKLTLVVTRIVFDANVCVNETVSQNATTEEGNF
jgi:hypothetical protein